MAADQSPVLSNLTSRAAAITRGLCGLGLAASSLLLLLLSHHPVTEKIIGIHPIFWLVGIAMLAGALYLLLCRNILQKSLNEHGVSGSFTCLLLVGLVMRLLMLPSTPMLENDYYRYLWDGAVTATAENPYAHAPQSIVEGNAPDSLKELANTSGGLLDRVTYPALKSIYPPVAQVSFLLANWLEPFSLMAWRTIVFGFDLISLGLLIAVLRQLGRPMLWSAIYWCNPVLVKEFFNSAHMDAALVPFLLATLLLILKARSTWAGVTLALASGCKIWPLLLFPTLMRPFVQNWRQALPTLLAFAAIASLLAAPVLWTGLTQDSGFVAYSQSWERNDALFGLIAWFTGTTLEVLSFTSLDAGRIARFAVALVIAAAAVGINLKNIKAPVDVAQRFLFIAALLFLLSPTQYPWYYSWLLPFLAVLPCMPLLLLTALLPLYYLRFYFEIFDFAATAETLLAWLQFGPVLALLTWQWAKSRQRAPLSSPPNLHGKLPET